MLTNKTIYIVRLPHDSLYDEMLRDQGYLDYVYYFKKHSIQAVLIDLKNITNTKALNSIPEGSSVIIAVMRTSQIRIGLKFAKYLKNYRRAIIIFGRLINYGAFSTPYIDCSQYSCVDFVLPAKCGEIAVLKYAQGDSSCLINNMSGEKKPVTMPYEINISDIETSDVAHGNIFLTYELSRGCPHRCFYCSNSLSAFQHKEAGRIISDIKFLVRINHTRKMVFVGPEINFNNEFLEELLVKLKDVNIEWTSYAVARGLDQRVLSQMRDTGCRMLSIGLESATQETLNTLGKGTKVDDVAKIIQDCRHYNICTQIHVIVGFPYETINDINELKRFIFNNREAITNVNISNLDIPKDSRVVPNADGRGIVLDRSNEGEYYLFYEKGRSWEEKTKETWSRIADLERFVKGLGLSVFTCKTSFDDSFEELYLQSLNLNHSGSLIV